MIPASSPFCMSVQLRCVRSGDDGYCIRYGCQLPGRECGDSCREAPRIATYRKTRDEATWACVETCEVAPGGADPYSHNPTCPRGLGL